jgi:uncharacterized protein (TIGR02453 family)
VAFCFYAYRTYQFYTNFGKTEIMSIQINPSTLEFLNDLKENNYREWFQENKTRYVDATENFKQFVNALIIGINEFDKSVGSLEPSDCLFRIYRDVRFRPIRSPTKRTLAHTLRQAAEKALLLDTIFI